ncbi:hypothetical protein ACMFMG_011780 [Clarireedia jacksonii]
MSLPSIHEAIVPATPSPLPVYHGIFSPDCEEPSLSIAHIDAKSQSSIHGAIVPATPSPLPVCHDIFSPNCEEPPKVARNLDLDVDLDLHDVHETHLDVDSDEEYLAAMNAQQLSQQLRQDATSRDLGSKFKEWLNNAMKEDENVYKHSELTRKLFTLGKSVHPSDASENPTDSSRPADEPLVSDMADLIKWVHAFYFGAEWIIDDFRKLGRAAQACNKEQYRRHKLDCVYRIFVEFDYINTSANQESSQILSRKRKSWDITR